VEIIANTTAPSTTQPIIENRALQAILAAVNSEDSVFRIAATGTQQAQPDSGGAVHTFSGGLRLVFSNDSFNQDRGLYYELVEKLTQLLKEAGSADSLEIKLGLSAGPPAESKGPSQTLVIELVSKGSSAEQAELRWGLGLAHLQQALLFTSRLLRQQLSSRSE
jgi:hypothetical protein